MSNTLRLLCIGDLVGNPGVALFEKLIPSLREKNKIDAVIVNGENADKRGNGITPDIIMRLKASGADIITTGNHAWGNKRVYEVFDSRDDIIRPANYPSACPGKGYTFFNVRDKLVAVVNIHGRVFIPDLIDCPFKAITSLLTLIHSKTNIIIVDFHAEATSEKRAMGMMLDGKVSVVFGTHTHVQTADEYIMPRGTSYITDLGCCGALHSIIGMRFVGILNRFLIHQKFGKLEVEDKGPMVLSGIKVEIDADSGKTKKIERIKIIDE